MAVLKAFADVLQECYDKKKSGALYVAVSAASDHLVRFFLREGEVCYLSFGTVKERECLDILDCYEFGKAVFLEGVRPPCDASGMPKTDEIIAVLRKSGKTVEFEQR